MSKPRLLDLFCGAGGAAMGYYRAGFEVVGVDINPQPHYPFEFYQGDALAFLHLGGGESFDAVHASPPCQLFTRASHLRVAQGKQTSSLNLIPETRFYLNALGMPHDVIPYVIENVPGAPLLNPVTLCGSSFGLRVRRHRLFESNLLLTGAGPCLHEAQGRPVGVYGSPADNIPEGGRTARDVPDAQHAMGIDWMPRWSELKEAIPPAYTEWIGRQLLAALVPA